MAETTAIAWTDSTFNPWMGCAKVSSGCDHCYAEISTPARTMKISWGPHAQRHRTSSGTWNQPRRWDGSHAEFVARMGRRRRVFCASLADVFDNRAEPAWRSDLWKLIRETPNLDWLLLTKRIGNVSAMLPADWGTSYRNVWLGITVVNQEEADRDIPKLLRTPAAVHWLSMEPLLGSVDLPEVVDWVVVGGESGNVARQMDLRWVEDLRRQCEAARVPFFFKQRGGADKDKGGCLLNGAEAKAWPEVA